MVAEAGIEPALPKEQDFESSASTSSATQPRLHSGRSASANVCNNQARIIAVALAWSTDIAACNSNTGSKLL